MAPSIDGLQTHLSKAIQVMLKMAQDIPQWQHLVNQQRIQQQV